ncbi:Peroxiredoxin-5, mitochondrial [Eufriesea mexicana]|uniref:peroxiredoxin-5, mitochondrial-like n=1 Tax=Eufriesea mexicana TaxID=516756 RepID=UPI00083BB359|nr:PREDICTED: peroxiredoxin-5, mitochondrial-like [Eufriesea mexicana]OAD60427.1 Peroxiredoxin-5, mitochondrial [Eufriesea mexicana]
MNQLVNRAISISERLSFGHFIREFRVTSQNMVIAVGEKLPTIDLFEDSPANKVNLAQIASGKKVVIFGVPGAFTPGCSKTHLPGYIQKAQELKSKGVAEIFCIAVNDPFVMTAWGKEHGAEGKVRMLADTAAEFTNALGLSIDIPALGKRSKRYSMVLEDGVVKELNVEPDNVGLSCSLAQNIGL